MDGMSDNFEQSNPEDENGTVQLSGSVEHVIYSNEDSGFAICDLGTDSNELITVKGIMPYIGEGDRVTVRGKWGFTAKYGKEFRVETFEKEMPADEASILRYLSSGAIKGIGPKIAQRIVDEFGEETFDVMEHHPDWLASIQGITRKHAKAIAEEFRDKAGIRSAMIFFRDFFGAALTVRIYKRFGSQAVDLAKNNPYRLCEEIDGISFDASDRMAQKLGLEKDSEERICSGILYLLSSDAQQNGHVCLPRKKLVQSACALLDVTEEQAEQSLSSLLKREKIRSTVFNGVSYLYDIHQYNHEKYIAAKLCLLDKVCPAADTQNIGAFIRREEAETGVNYASLQRKAITLALENGVMLLTGGPGTGKTTVVRALLHIFDSMGMQIALCAPTGRAAKRLSETTSCEAKTIHRLLEYGGEESEKMKFSRDEQNLLDEDVIIVDEASMVDNLLMSALLRAVKLGAHLILIGDADQLPSVGPGNVLRDLVASQRFSTVCLTEIFRQAQKSLIVTNAHAVNHGEMPDLSVKNNDFFFLPRADDLATAATVAELCKTRLPKAYGEMAISGLQVIVPSRKGVTGTENLNRVLQEALNPPSPNKREYQFRGIVFREGDRVMQTRNNYDIQWERPTGERGSGIFNGDIGIVEEVCKNTKVMKIRFDDREVCYEFPLLEELEMAYAITVHKSQGSEYPIVVLPMGTVPPMLKSRNLLYTAITRAQCMAVVVGKESTIREMTENNRLTMRYTGLVNWLNKGLG